MRRAAVLVLALAASSTALAQPDASSAREASLEASLRASAFDFDGVSFLGAQRTLLMGIFETYCAAELLIPPEDGVRARDLVLGIGCLAGATTLLVLGIRRLRSPKETTHARARLVGFYEARRDGRMDPDDFEARLFAAARRDRRRRWVRFALGVLELAAAATVAGLTGRDRIDRAAGTSIAIGTSVLSILGLAHAFIRSPAERAAARHRAAATAW